MNSEFIEAITRVLDHYYIDELRHQREKAPHLGALDPDHIVESLRVLVEEIQYEADKDD